MKIVSIQDNNGDEVQVELNKFINHINEFHKNGISIHEERGHYFTVNDKFREKLKKMITK
jgi:hypothetical protein